MTMTTLPWPVVVFVMLLGNLMVAMCYKASVHFELLKANDDRSTKGLTRFSETFYGRTWSEHWMLPFPWFGVDATDQRDPAQRRILRRTQQAIRYCWISLAAVPAFVAIAWASAQLQS